jgi:TonB-linked SusC/RagA family outer membrane protein
MKKTFLLGCLMLFFCCFQAVAQQRTITGTVVAADGTPLSNASVIVVGQKSGETTGPDGSFSIKAPANANRLRISYVGYEPLDVSIEGQSNVTVTLQPSATNLNEVVVTGYTSQKKKDITGSVAVVNVEDLKKVPAGSPEQMLQGRASGVNITTTGQPGSESNIRIRGITSFGDVSPLVIIDGVQGSLRDINANDIESFQVLKDAGAASIYGVRGSNGVIIITTKIGKSGKPTITYEGFYGTQQPLKGNVFNLLNTPEMAEVTWLALRNSGQVDSATGNPTHTQYGSGATPVIPDYILVGNLNGVVGQPTADQLAKYNIDYSKGDIYQITAANKTGTDWYHELFKPAPIQSHTISAAGGGDKSTYYFSMGYYDQKGTFLNTYLKRYSIKVNTTFNIKDNIRIGENLYMFYKDNPRTDVLGETNIAATYREQPIIPVYDINGGWAGTKAAGLGNSWNPYARAAQTKDNKGNTWDIMGNVFAEIDFLKYFTARTSFGGTLNNFYYYGFGFHDYQNAENNTSNSFNENSGYDRSWTWTNTLAYNQVFGKHNVKVLGGLEAIEDYGRGVGGNALGFFTDNPNYRILSNGSS